jgi:serine/threonine protein kinase
MKAKVSKTFAQRLAASKLLEPGRLAQACAAVGEGETALCEYLLSQGWLTRFQVRQLRAGARRFHVDKYIVVDYLGRGGNSLVFKALHTLLPGRYVALKTLDCRNLHHSDEALTRFRREIEILGGLEHPNIIRALDVIRTRSQLYLVLEHVAGRDLGTVVQDRGPLPVVEATAYAIQTARGLAYAHDNGIVHRDLKPSNLLLTSEGVVKISDLGLARLFAPGQQAELTLKGCCLGTPEFMAPEQAEDASEADPRSDIYSLGATLFHLLTAELPVEGSSQYQRLQRLLTSPPRSLAESLPNAPPALIQVVDNMRARDRDARPATAAQVIALLEPFAGGQTSSESPRWGSRRKAEVILAILRGEADLAEAAARHAVPIAVLEIWRQRFLEGAELALDPATPQDQTFADHVRDLHATIAKQAMKIEKLKTKLSSRNGK